MRASSPETAGLPTLGAADAQVPERMSKIMTNLKSDGRMTMDDTFVQPCLQESERWEGMYEKIERERSSLEEIAAFENEARKRQSELEKNKGAFRFGGVANLENY